MSRVIKNKKTRQERMKSLRLNELSTPDPAALGGTLMDI